MQLNRRPPCWVRARGALARNQGEGEGHELEELSWTQTPGRVAEQEPGHTTQGAAAREEGARGGRSREEVRVVDISARDERRTKNLHACARQQKNQHGIGGRIEIGEDIFRFFSIPLFLITEFADVSKLDKLICFRPEYLMG